MKTKQEKLGLAPASLLSKAEKHRRNLQIFEQTRPAMHSYEVARSAETMRDHFNVPCEEFARRTGLAPHYVRNLLQAIDHLPPLLMQKWRERRPIPFDYFFLWSRLSPEKAIASFNEYIGLRPRKRAARGAKKRQRPN